MRENISSYLRNPKDTLFRWSVYFRRGHSMYLVFIISFANFVVIQYRLLIQYIPLLKYIFTNLVIFALAFFLVYIPLAILIGWWDTKRGTVPISSRVMAKANPWNMDITKALYLMCEGKYEEAKKILEKWLR
ncbi:MAG: hypothetical protein DRJ66_05345 [Thermoprotei archaeon]|nr:MAG: hypothetical protein DRJ66_05345 [Thermoprotei archaeon]RLF20069.1 MAG: hypothetical protein DRZ82_03445 [Thermoprotei archaeon]